MPRPLRTKGRCKCPIGDCPAAYDDPEVLRHHLRNHHKMPGREACDLVARYLVQGDDLEKAKRDYNALAAAGLIQHKVKRIPGERR